MKRIAAFFGALWGRLSGWRKGPHIQVVPPPETFNCRCVLPPDIAADYERSEITARARRARIYRGVQVAVARELGLTEGHVSLVARGLRSSARVELALATAVRRLEKAAA